MHVTDGVHHDTIDIACNSRGADAGLHDGDAVSSAVIAIEFYFKFVPANFCRYQGGQTGESGSVGDVFADTNRNTHLVYIVSGTTIFIKETNL